MAANRENLPAGRGKLARPGPLGVGERIRQVRITKRLSQTDVAEPAMTASYLSMIESGRRVPSSGALQHIADRLGVDIDELISGKPTGIESRMELLLQQARADAHRGDIDGAENQLLEVLQACDEYDMSRLAARAKVVLAGLFERRGDIARARDLFEGAEKLLSGEPEHLKFEALVGLTRCIHRQGDPRYAVHLLETYLMELRRQNMEEPVACMRVLSALVHLYRVSGFERRSREVAEEAIALAPQVDDPEQIACMNMNVARALLDQGRHDDAIDVLRQAEHIYQSLDWPIPEVRSKINRGMVEIDKARYQTARDTLLEALSILDQYPAENSLRAAVLNELGHACRLMGDVKEAISHLRAAREFLGADDAFERAVNQHELGLSLIDSDSNLARTELLLAAQTYQVAGSLSDAAKSLLELGRILMKEKDVEGAAKIWEQGLELASSDRP